MQRTVKNFARICGSVEKEHDQRPKPCRGEGGEESVFGLQRQKQEVTKEELDKERRATEDEDEPFRRFAKPRVRTGLADAKRCGKEEASQQGDNAKVDVPEHAGADQRELFAERETFARQQSLAIAKGPQTVVLNRLQTAHAPALRWASPPVVAWPRVSRFIRRSSEISEIRVKSR